MARTKKTVSFDLGEPVSAQDNFFDAVRKDPEMTKEQKSDWLSKEPIENRNELSEFEIMVLDINSTGHRFELHNHKTNKPEYSWSCCVGETMQCGYKSQGKYNRNWWRYYGRTPFEAVKKAYDELKSGIHD